MTHVPWLFTILDDIAECFEERVPIPLHLAVQMTPEALEHAWKNVGSIRIGWKTIGEASIRNMILFNARPRHFAEAVLALMGRNIETLKSVLDVRTWKPLRDGLDLTMAVLAGSGDPAALKTFASVLRELNREPWNSSWIVFALGDAVEAIEHGYDTDRGITWLMRAVRVGVQGRARSGRDFQEKIARLFERFLITAGPPPVDEIVGAAIRISQEPP